MSLLCGKCWHTLSSLIKHFISYIIRDQNSLCVWTLGTESACRTRPHSLVLFLHSRLNWRDWRILSCLKCCKQTEDWVMPLHVVGITISAQVYIFTSCMFTFPDLVLSLTWRWKQPFDLCKVLVLGSLNVQPLLICKYTRVPLKPFCDNEIWELSWVAV